MTTVPALGKALPLATLIGTTSVSTSIGTKIFVEVPGGPTNMNAATPAVTPATGVGSIKMFSTDKV